MGLGFILICSQPLQATPKKPIFAKQNKTIILDPGHGGHDNGASGPEGTFEKNVTLELARTVAAELENTYRVILTRTDDYFLNIPSRTSMANHSKADLFISIHSGGSFLHQANGITLYFFNEISESVLTPDTDPSKPFEKIDDRSPWSNIQNRHQRSSKILAQLLLNRINEQAIFKKSEMLGAPLMVLEGADMPAVCLEIGYITNSAEEKSLRDISVLSNIVQGIRNGIDDFFEKVR
ncbi:MAG: N-acetylmuramoyl-L-alanine amidase [Desulfobacterales bacterium]